MGGARAYVKGYTMSAAKSDLNPDYAFFTTRVCNSLLLDLIVVADSKKYTIFRRGVTIEMALQVSPVIGILIPLIISL
jgi:hypothetical protein